ncbi:MAG TPA: helix-turn-helix transcriptional regulator, partial [Saprospiraceae bacterium]|nr:helix-turn-helix transcriptional regulator [Saprospiraceae bacterium]
MKQPTLNEKIIFGLKLKEFRKEKQMLLSDLARISGISVSYLNEIEKAKKYPRPEKIEQLATALDIPMADFISTELSAKYTPVADLLDSNFLHELPLDVFGIDKVKIIEMVAEAPSRIGAFISTLVEMSRLHGQEAEHFYIGAMRTYQEMYNNYFEEIESAALQYLTSIG